MSEKPLHPRPRRVVDWINPAGAKKVHSLIDKVYTRKNLEMAWERVKANRIPTWGWRKLPLSCHCSLACVWTSCHF
jgi:hypothetical protein